MESDQVPSDTTRVEERVALRFVSRLFEASGVPAAAADLVAEVLVCADLRGIRSHGMARIPYFLTRLRGGVIDPDPRIEFQRGSSTTGVLDAAGGLGIIAAERAMAEAMAMAGEHGTGFVVVANSSHFGYAGFWAERALAAGMIGISMSNSGGRVAPTFGTSPILGTNPLAVAMPGPAGGTDFSLDMATSTVAVGKVETALREGRVLPDGWISPGPVRLDDDGILGMETALLPLGGEGTETGGHKGYGLGLMVELLCGALGGTGFAGRIAGAAGEMAPSMGHLMAAIRVDGFRPLKDVRDDMEATFDLIRRSDLAPGCDRIYIHGEPEAEATAEHRTLGIPVPTPVLAQLEKWATILDLEPVTA